MMCDLFLEYQKGETLRLAGLSLYRQVKKRFPGIPRPPRSIRPEKLPDYESWYNEEVLSRYEEAGLTEEKHLTRWELKSDDRWFNAIIRAQTYLEQIKEKERQERWAKFDVDPYGHLAWGVGSEDDFGCFDFDVQGEEVAIVTTLNSETGCFIMRIFGEIVSKEEAVNEAIGQVDQIYEWCGWNGVEPGEEGWNYGGWRFVEAVKDATGSDTTNPFPTPSNKGG